MAESHEEQKGHRRLKSEEESNTIIDDSMTLAQFSQTTRSSTHKPSSPTTVIANYPKSASSCKRKHVFIETDRAKMCAARRAEEVQANLDPEFPSFVKSMVPSHVATGFWLGLPSQFCSMYLPKQDVMVTLVDENGEEYSARYLPEKTGLSGGWKGFSSAHKLVVGDALVFQLVKATKFKVYIIRAYGLAEVDGALGLLDLDARGKQTDPGKGIEANERPARKRPKSLPLAVFGGNTQYTMSPVAGTIIGHPLEQTGNDSEEVDSEVLEDNRFLGSIVEFKDMRNVDNFTIVVNGSVIDSEIPKCVRAKYYELCSTQKAILHEHLLEGINSKLVAGIISETVSIADAIRGSKLSTFPDEFAIWDKSLRAFEELGMNVGFLRSRLQQLLSIAFESEEARDAKRYKKAKLGRARAEEEIRSIELRLMELKEASKMFEGEIETLKEKAENHELLFRAGVNAPW